MVASRLAKMPVGRPVKAADLPVYPTQAVAADMLMSTMRLRNGVRSLRLETLDLPIRKVSRPPPTLASPTKIFTKQGRLGMPKLLTQELFAVLWMRRLAKMPQGARTDITAIAVMSPTQEQAAATLGVSVDSIQRITYWSDIIKIAGPICAFSAGVAAMDHFI